MPWKRADDLGARLKALREALGLTQQQFASTVGVVDQTISDYERGESRPSRSRLERLARQLQIPVAVFGQDGPDPTEALQRARSLAGARSGIEPRPGARGPGRRAEDIELRAEAKRKDAARLDVIARLIRAYRDAGKAPGPGTLDEWLDILVADSPNSRSDGSAADGSGQ